MLGLFPAPVFYSWTPFPFFEGNFLVTGCPDNSQKKTKQVGGTSVLTARAVCLRYNTKDTIVLRLQRELLYKSWQILSCLIWYPVTDGHTRCNCLQSMHNDMTVEPRLFRVCVVRLMRLRLAVRVTLPGNIRWRWQVYSFVTFLISHM